MLHGFGGDPDQAHVVETCAALADAGSFALRFAFRDHRPPTMTLAGALDDAAHALDRLRDESADLPLGVVGFSFGGAVAALLAGRDTRIRAAVLAAAPAGFRRSPDDARLDPVGELACCRAAVLLIQGSRDREVAREHLERYRDALAGASVATSVVIVDGGDHDFAPAGPRAEMTRQVAGFMTERLG